MKKVLIITTHFAPDRHVGAKRPTKFAKYLPEFGWQPVVLTMEEKHYHGIDDSLSKDLANDIRIFRVGKWSFSSGGESPITSSISKVDIKKASKTSLFIKKFIRRLLLCYDFAWLLPACYKGVHIVRKQKIDVLFSTSPNPEAHLVGLYLRIMTNRPWVTDFRDPWTIPPLSYYHHSAIRIKIENLLERIIISKSDCITVTAENFRRNILTVLGQRYKGKIYIIYNGYDKDDFNKPIPSINNKFAIKFLGTWAYARSPENFLLGLSKFLSSNNLLKKDDMKIEFIGEDIIGKTHNDNSLHSRVVDIVRNNHLEGIVEIKGYLPYREGLNELTNTSVLLIVTSPEHERAGCLSSKLFEYLVARKPVLALVPCWGEVAKIVRDCNAGEIANPENVDEIANKINTMYYAWKQDKLNYDFNDIEIRKYDRQKQVVKLATIFDSLLSRKK